VPDHDGVRMLVRDLNRVYRQTRALHSRDVTPSGFTWIDANDADHNVFSFLRWGDDGSVLACIANFAGNPHEGYRIGLPKGGRWAEVVNTDSELYCGSGVGNWGAVEATEPGWHGQPYSTVLRVPPLGAVWLRWEGPVTAAGPAAEDGVTADGTAAAERPGTEAVSTAQP